MSALTSPIDIVVGQCSRALATAIVTDSIGSGWLAGAASAARIDAYFHAARPTPVATTDPSRSRDPIHAERPAATMFPSVSRTRAIYPRQPQHPVEPQPVDCRGDGLADAGR